MARSLAALCCLCLAGMGCNSTVKNDNPVFGPSPSRTSLVDAPNAIAIAEAQHLADPDQDSASPGPIQQVAAQDGGDDTDLFNATMVATANGAPIFAGEVLERYGDYLRAARAKLSDADYQRLREEIIRRDLKGHIQKHLLVERTKGELKPDQVKALNKQLESMFDKKVEELKKELKVTTRTELERELNDRGTSLNDVRNSYIAQGIAQGYLEHRAEKPKPITRQELVDYYREHEQDYFVPAKVRWQQVQITYASSGGRAAATAKLEQARAELERGVSFAEVVAKYSDGPTKREHGVRDWTNHGSLADEDLERLLFAMPAAGKIEPHFGETACQLVQVLERTEDGMKPFAEVQEEIHEKLRRSGPRNVKDLIDELYSQAIIETKYAYLGQDESD